jgi:hypothetical protein
MVDKRGKRTNSSEEEIVEKVLSNRQNDDYKQNKIQRIKVKEVTTTDKRKSWEGIWRIMEKSSTENTKLFYKVLKNKERKGVPIKMHKQMQIY